MSDYSVQIAQALFVETMHCLKDCDGFELELAFLNIDEISSVPLQRPKAQIPAHPELLTSAIEHIDDTQFSALKANLTAAKNHLHWKIDNGGYYAKGDDVGGGYKTGNMHTLLIGPENALIPAEEFLLGFFLLSPWTLYRDHKHLAPELYIPLTGPSGWRFHLGKWQDYPAGHRIINAPNAPHATRVYETPFLAIFAWTRDIASICSVVASDDWAEIETDLRHHRAG